MSIRRLVTLVVGIALLLAIVEVHRSAPDYFQERGPIATRGDIGEAVDAGGLTVAVSKVRVTRKLGVAIPPRSAVSKGIWVILDARITAAWRPSQYSETFLEAPDGSTYDMSERVSLEQLTNGFFQPGIARQGQIFFEIPPDKLPGAVVHIGQGTEFSDDYYSPEAVVDLKLDADEVESMIESAPPVLHPKSPRYGP